MRSAFRVHLQVPAYRGPVQSVTRDRTKNWASLPSEFRQAEKP